MRYTTAADIAAFLGWADSDAARLAQIAAVGNTVEAAVDAYTHSQFDQEDATAKVFDGTGTNIISLGFFLRTLTTAELLDSEGNVDETLSDVYAQPYPLRYGMAYRWVERRVTPDAPNPYFPLGTQNVRLTGDWGYSLATMPPAVTAAIAYGVKHAFDARLVNDFVSEDLGLGRSRKYKREDREWAVTALPSISRALLDPWVNSRWMVA